MDFRFGCWAPFAGYLPTGDKEVITTADTTLQALEASLDVLAVGGCICIAAYVGHAGGKAEYECLKRRMAVLDPACWLAVESALFNMSQAPILLLLYKRKL